MAAVSQRWRSSTIDAPRQPLRRPGGALSTAGGSRRSTGSSLGTGQTWAPSGQPLDRASSARTPSLGGLRLRLDVHDAAGLEGAAASAGRRLVCGGDAAHTALGVYAAVTGAVHDAWRVALPTLPRSRPAASAGPCPWGSRQSCQPDKRRLGLAGRRGNPTPDAASEPQRSSPESLVETRCRGTPVHPDGRRDLYRAPAEEESADEDR